MRERNRIESMRTYFEGPAQSAISVRTFVNSVIAQRKQAAHQQMVTMGFVQADLADMMSIQLGNPDAAVEDLPLLRPYVNGGVWLVKCDDCGGVEFLDWEDPIFMCCTCWNFLRDRNWRKVRLPGPRVRALIERILLKRPESKTRSWYPRERLRELMEENRRHDVEDGATEEELVEAEADE